MSTIVLSVNQTTKRFLDTLNKLDFCRIMFTVNSVPLHWSTHYSGTDDQYSEYVKVYLE